MSFNIGIDIEEIDRFRKELGNTHFLERVFTKKELEYCMGKASPEKHLAARFAGKEAVIKACSSYSIDVHVGDIEIINNEEGIPHVTVKGIDGYIIKLSLSHSDSMAIAQAMVIEDDDR